MNDRLHMAENAEDMTKYCPVSECGDCTAFFCEKYSRIYKGCTCKDCEEVREKSKKYAQRKEREVIELFALYPSAEGIHEAIEVYNLRVKMKKAGYGDERIDSSLLNRFVAGAYVEL